ncbi:MAG: thiamine-phosphate kinase [Methylotenera sp.]|uniref:thiamine-phosphate kinase n=1 Tax=Methylotenera sp. TaxID=2051956 RepID=UPI0024878FA1|nr:thiamine-phosphate kinase [Methylotenera sp.]MDI1310050.1 thiamine-phosphate kinase [Methylotenera sp.]
MTPEFNLIKQYFTRPTRHTKLGVGDDAALISLSTGMEFAISADMLVAGTHFFADCDAYKLGWKSLAVNISDMAAMGANAKWATLAIALPDINASWLAEFSRGFFACADSFNVDLIGGDTTRGPLTISVQIMGEVPIGKAIKRSGAKVGDEIWVSGKLGDAALALAHIQSKLALPEAASLICAKALHAPQPRLALGLALRDIANSAIDISDGLLADLGHILEQSNVGAIVELSNIPHSTFVDYPIDLHDESLRKLVLAGGDDYELCFTAPVQMHAEIVKICEKIKLQLSCIGHITSNTGLILHGLENEILNIKETGFDHFS